MSEEKGVVKVVVSQIRLHVCVLDIMRADTCLNTSTAGLWCACKNAKVEDSKRTWCDHRAKAMKLRC